MKHDGKQRLNLTVMALVSVYLILPLMLTFLYSLFQEWTSILPTGLTLRYYADLFADPGFYMPIVRTMIISTVPVLLCSLITLLAMYVVVVHHPRWQKIMQILCTVPYSLQGVILAISVLALYSGLPLPFSDRIAMLVCTYCVLILPYTYRGIQNSLNAINARQMIEAAQLLGCHPLAAYLRVVVPNLVSGITVSAMLSVSLLFGDFVVVNIIGGSYYSTAQMYLYKMMFRSGQQTSAMIVILFMLTLLISASVLLLQQQRQRNAQVKQEEADGIHTV
ncbi:MAG: ABC transporter permease subunit [Clostridiales bacterium]|nr:ABC transporter permease subunit [Clostridiales bacterium]